MRRGTICAVTLVVAFAAALLASSSASAAYEQVGTFAGTPGALQPWGNFAQEEGTWPEEVQLGGASGMAVNYTGAGGVPAGTIYAATFLGVSMRIIRFNPDGSFSESWTFNETPGFKERCGPEGEPAHPVCRSQPRSSPATSVDVDVDPTTGNVYVLDDEGLSPGANLIHVYSPDGSKLISEFGVRAAGAETTAASPDKIHSSGRGGLAVDGSGEVYVFDTDGAYHRLMVFEPETPGAYEHYVYAGQDHDIQAGFKQQTTPTTEPVTDAAGDVFVATEESVAKLDPSQPSAPPLCEFVFPTGGMEGMTVNPLSGAVFFFTYKDKRIHQLSPCDGEGNFGEEGTFVLAPKRNEIYAMAIDPSRHFESTRAAGVLYAASTDHTGGVTQGTFPIIEVESALGYIFAPPKELAPQVLSQSVSSITTSSARLEGEVNPRGSQTRYAFQYLDDTAYEANEPDERQSLTLSATGGVFGIGFEGKHLGGPATATLTTGSTSATALRSVTATATLKAATGTGTLNGAKGQGTAIAGSNTLTSVSSTEGSFEAGQGISGPGIPEGATIVSVKAEGALSSKEIVISAPPTASGAHIGLSSGTTAITSLSTSEGSFEAGQSIEGANIKPNTTISSVKAGELVLSKPVIRPATGVDLKAGSATLTAVSPGIGSFEAGQSIEGEGIAAGTQVVAVGATTLTLSKPATKPGSAVAVFHPGPDPLAVGEQVEGPGIAPGTTITSIKAGQATLSAPATESGTEVPLEVGLPANVSAAALREALEALPTIGEGNVRVSGGPGDEAGSNPYEITFSGDFENLDVALLSADGFALSGGAATATIEGEHDGGAGFAKGAGEVPTGGGVLEGSSPLPVGDAISGLQPDTGYHYRVVATSHCSVDSPAKVCEGAGPARSFRTAPAQGLELADNRAWEIVSPTEKHGGQVLPSQPEVSSCAVECKPGGAYNHLFPRQASTDGDALVYEGTPFAFDEGALVENEYISRRTSSGWQTTNLTPRALFSKTSGYGYRAFDPDLTEGLLGQITPSLSPEAPSDYFNFYRQPTGDPASLSPLLTNENALLQCVSGEGTGSLKLTYAGSSTDFSRFFVSANDMLTEEASGGCGETDLYEWSTGQLRLLNYAPGDTETLPGARFAAGPNAISKDGSHAYWTSKAGQLYARVDGIGTVEVKDAGKFLTGSADGSKALLEDGCLYDLATEACEDLTGGKGGFEGVSGTSEDLSHIYFVDSKVLTGEEGNALGAKALEGKDNLYAWAQGATSFIGTLAPGDVSDNGRRGTWGSEIEYRTAEASPSGRWLAFRSTISLTGFDNTGLCEVITFGPPIVYASAPCNEVYLYDAETSKLRCASCSSTGAPPLGPSVLRRKDIGSLATNSQPRYLLDSGRLYFDSQDALSQFDTNGRVEDVYQYEPSEVGSCKRTEGCVSLISAGRAGADSNFLAIDPSGKNVFFTTRDRLNKPDEDEAIDVYDAREGGVPLTEPQAPECQGEACQPPTSPPNDPTPASSNFNGAGNVAETKPSKKHKKKKKHVKKHKRKSHAKARTNRNRGGAK
jgi:hypothetical protein